MNDYILTIPIHEIQSLKRIYDKKYSSTAKENIISESIKEHKLYLENKAFLNNKEDDYMVSSIEAKQYILYTASLPEVEQKNIFVLLKQNIKNVENMNQKTHKEVLYKTIIEHKYKSLRNLALKIIEQYKPNPPIGRRVAVTNTLINFLAKKSVFEFVDLDFNPYEGLFVDI